MKHSRRFALPMSALAMLAVLQFIEPAWATPYHPAIESWAALRLNQIALGIDCDALDEKGAAQSFDSEWSMSVVDPVYLCIGTMAPRGNVPRVCEPGDPERGELIEDSGCAKEAEALLAVYADLRASIQADLKMAIERGDRNAIARMEDVAGLLDYDTQIDIRLRAGESHPEAVEFEFLQTASPADKLWMAALGEALLRGSERGVNAPALQRPPPPVRITLTYQDAPSCIPALSQAEPTIIRDSFPDLRVAVESVVGSCAAEGALRVTLAPLELRSGAVIWLPGGTILEVL